MRQGQPWLLSVIMLLLLGACAAPRTPGASPSPSVPPPSLPDATLPIGTPDLEGTAWTLVSLNGNDVIEGTTITLSFGDDGTLSGDAGCNSYSGQYTATDGTLSTSEIINTEVFCQDPADVMEQEDAYFDALRTAAVYTITTGTLELLSAADATLVYRSREASPEPTDTTSPDAPATVPSTPELDGTAWVLTEINDSAVREGTTPTLNFEENGRVGGEGGCNSFGGQYTAAAGTMSFSDISSTLRACAEQAVNEQEQAYFDALHNAAAYRLDADRLEIKNAVGDTTLVFNAQ
jgi:heat shock protein HslJ